MKRGKDWSKAYRLIKYQDVLPSLSLAFLLSVTSGQSHLLVVFSCVIFYGNSVGNNLLEFTGVIDHVRPCLLLVYQSRHVYDL